MRNKEIKEKRKRQNGEIKSKETYLILRNE